MKLKTKKTFKRIVSCILCAMILIHTVQVNAENRDDVPYDYSNIADGETKNITDNNIDIDGAETHGGKELEFQPKDMSTTEIKQDDSKIYQNGVIKIYNQNQLYAIGSGNPVHTNDDKENAYGTGNNVVENGTVIKYSIEAKYQLMNDIELDLENLWMLPEGFTGEFISEPTTETDPLYDPDAKTVFIYHAYQLLTMLSENADSKPIMSKDMICSEFGKGEILYNNRKEEQDFLTYSKEHRYVLSKKFTEKMPDIVKNVNEGTKGIAASTLENNKTYIIYAKGKDDNYYALTESGKTNKVTLVDNEIIADESLQVKWTYNHQNGTFQNSQGNYLNIKEMYAPPFPGELLQRFNVEERQGGYIIKTNMPKGQGGYPLYLHLFENEFEMDGYETTQIYFAFVENSDNSIEPSTPPITSDENLNIRKYVDKLEGKNEYDLNLTVNGAYAQEGRNKADIIYVIDTTGSMTLSMDGRTENSYERWNGIISSMQYMTNMFNSNPNADLRHSMICFSGSEDGPYTEAEMVQDWTKNTEEILNRLNEKRNSLGGGTNYEAACRELVDGKLTKGFRNDAEKVVVFISDGEPNRYYDENGYGVHDGAVDSREPIRRAKEMLRYLTPIDMFYSVGVGADILEQSNLQELASELMEEQGVKTGYAHCNNTDDIKKAFDEIIRSIIKIKYDHVTIADTLSKYAELVDGTKLRITVTNKEGQQVNVVEGEKKEGVKLVLPATTVNQSAELMLMYEETKKLLTLKFPDRYILEDGWEYKITATIKPTQEAYKEYKGSGYPHIGDGDTGVTSSEQKGFYSNDKANLDYVLNDVEKSTIEYPKPVIQVTKKVLGRLPETGGVGMKYIYTIGILLLSCFAALEFKKRK